MVNIFLRMRNAIPVECLFERLLIDVLRKTARQFLIYIHQKTYNIFGVFTQLLQKLGILFFELEYHINGLFSNNGNYTRILHLMYIDFHSEAVFTNQFHDWLFP